MVGLAAAGAAACEEERNETSILSSIFFVGPASVLATWQVAPTKPRPRRRHCRARAKRVDTPGTMAALRAAVRAISVVPLPRPRVTAATSARVLPRVRRLGAVHKWAPGGHRGFCVTARQALSADTTHGALAENTDPHSFEVRETS